MGVFVYVCVRACVRACVRLSVDPLSPLSTLNYRKCICLSLEGYRRGEVANKIIPVDKLSMICLLPARSHQPHGRRCFNHIWCSSITATVVIFGDYLCEVGFLYSDTDISRRRAN